jgi:hypothetical protein
MSSFFIDQEEFWAGELGKEYITRNRGSALVASNLDFFAKALWSARSVKTCIEFGANIGMNLKALKLLHPNQEQHGIEVNADAVRKLNKIILLPNLYHTSISARSRLGSGLDQGSAYTHQSGYADASLWQAIRSFRALSTGGGVLQFCTSHNPLPRECRPLVQA